MVEISVGMLTYKSLDQRLFGRGHGTPVRLNFLQTFQGNLLRRAGMNNVEHNSQDIDITIAPFLDVGLQFAGLPHIAVMLQDFKKILAGLLLSRNHACVEV